MVKRILLLGGSFDPVHNGHLIISRSIAEKTGIGKVVLIPAGTAPHKPPADASSVDRLAMLRLAVGEEDLFEICELELDRGGVSYTYDTLVALREELGPEMELNWIIGADMLSELHKWNRAAKVIELAKMIVVARRNLALDEIFRSLTDYFKPRQLQRLRAGVTAAPVVEISSTQIRRRIAAGRSIRFLVPDVVESYIKKEGLYTSSAVSEKKPKKT